MSHHDDTPGAIAARVERLLFAQTRRNKRFEEIVRDEGEDLWVRLAALRELAERGFDGYYALASACGSPAVGVAIVEDSAVRGEPSWKTRDEHERTVFHPIVRGTTTHVLVRLAALEQIRDPLCLTAAAADTQAVEVGVRAIEQLIALGGQTHRIATIAESAKHSHVRLFARAYLAQDDGK